MFTLKDKTMDTNLYLADYYFPLLDSLNNKAKLYLVKKLTDSLLKSESLPDVFEEAAKDTAFRKLAGAWANDPEAEAMTSIIRDGRMSNHTRHIVPFDE